MESSQGLEQQQPTAEERAAIERIWAREHPGDETVPPDEALRILGEIRERMQHHEAEAVRRLQSKLTENRWYPRRQQRFAMGILLIVCVVAIILLSFSHR